MTLYETWLRTAYNPQGQAVEHVWTDYLAREKKVYENILSKKITQIEGTVSELSELLGLSHMHTAAFLDGIHEAVDGLSQLEALESDTQISFEIDFKRLYMKMVEYKAESLYTLEEWNNIFTAEERNEFYKEQKKSQTVIRGSSKIGRNEPCPCGSGKKYKKCCGA